MLLSNFYCCKWPNIEKIINPPGHTAINSAPSPFKSFFYSFPSCIFARPDNVERSFSERHLVRWPILGIGRYVGN